MSKPKILVIGSSVIDLIFQGEIFGKRFKQGRLSLAYGGKYVVDNLYQAFGGGGANAAVSLARQKFEVFLWSKVATDFFGKQIMDNLEKEDVETTLLEKDLKKSPLSTILLDPQGRRTIINYRSQGDNLSFSEKVKETLSSCQWLALFSMPRWPKKEKIEVFQYAKEKGLKIFLSLHGDEYRKGLSWNKDYFPYVEVLNLNVYELAAMLGTKAEKLSLKEDNFSRKLGIPIVVVTHDKHGSHLYSKDKVVHQQALPVKAVDATGAGDAFSAGFLGRYLKINDLQQAMEFAGRNAKAEIEVLGAQTGLLFDS